MKAFILGFDGLTWTTIRPYVEAGLLPHFERLTDQGACGTLKSTIPSITGPGWCSIFTGKKPDKHGVLEFRRTEGYKVVPVTRKTVSNAEAIWNIAGLDKKTVVINVPFTYPPDRVNGVMISGLMTPGEESEYVHPREWKTKLSGIIRDYRIDVDNSKHNLTGNTRALAQEIFDLTQNRRKLMNHLLDNEPWDLFFIVFTGPDRLQHIQWDKIVSMDPQCVAYYKLLDSILADVLAKIDDDTVLLVTSDHGFQAAPKAFYINRFLSNHGMLTFRKNVANRIGIIRKTLTRFNVSSTAIYSFIQRRKLVKLKHYLPKWLVDAARKTVPTYVGIRDYDVQWDRTTAYSLLGYGMISINLKGREPSGTIEMNEYEQLRQKIRELLLDYKDPQTGQPVIEAVYRKEELYPSGGAELPDLFAVPREGYSIKEEYSDRTIGDFKIANIPIVGDHHREGLIMAYGRMIRHVAVNADVCDVTPTALYLLGSAIPHDVDGRVLTELISEEFLAGHEMKWTRTKSGAEDPNSRLTPEQEKQIENHLRGLGYLA